MMMGLFDKCESKSLSTFKKRRRGRTYVFTILKSLYYASTMVTLVIQNTKARIVRKWKQKNVSIVTCFNKSQLAIDPTSTVKNAAYLVYLM